MSKRVRPPVPDDLTNQEKRKLMLFAKREAPFFYRAAALRHVVSETLDHHRAQNNKRFYSDWLAVCRNRIRSLEARNLDEFGRPRRPSEKPQEMRNASYVAASPRRLSEVVNLSDWKPK